VRARGIGARVDASTWCLDFFFSPSLPPLCDRQGRHALLQTSCGSKQSASCGRRRH
jgi:hypothetical protein